jgi:hypothetical protein
MGPYFSKLRATANHVTLWEEEEVMKSLRRLYMGEV